MQNNFGTEVKQAKRPSDFYYIRVNFKLNLLSVAIANTNSALKEQQGLNLNLQEITIKFGLREAGYELDFLMDDIKVDMYTKII